MGLSANWRQFALLVLVNAFVGGMVGLERTVVPLLAQHDFGVASKTVILSFIVTFGLVKALSNLLAGQLGDRIGRKPILVAGWLVGVPVPLIVIAAPNWGWIVFANVLLGINQGLCWSTTVIMKIDLVGPRRRGLALGINEAAGYLAVSLAALASGYLAAAYALRPQPFYLGIGFSLAGLVISTFFIRESHGHARQEQRELDGREPARARPPFRDILWLVSWKDQRLFAVSQAGMANNLNDGLAWGILPLFFAAEGLSIGRIGELAALYPAVWGVAQLGTGALSDRLGRKWMIVGGMWLQAVALSLLPVVHGFAATAVLMATLGLGTALVYPTLLAAIGDIVPPDWRASAVGVYRLWRDGGYVVGALSAGIVADLVGFRSAIGLVAGLTAASGAIVALRMTETLSRQAAFAGAPPGHDR